MNVTIVAATNRPDIIDSALLRPGRIDHIMYVSPPDLTSREDIFRIRIAKMSCDPLVDVRLLAVETEGFSGAEIVAVCREAAIKAMEEDLNVEFVSQRHLLSAIEQITPQITPEMIHFYDHFRK